MRTPSVAPYRSLADGLDLSAIEAFALDMRRRNLSDNTLDQRLWLLCHFAAAVHPVPVLDVDIDAIERFLDSRATGARGRRTYLSHIRALFDWATRFGLVETNAARRIPPPQVGRLVPRPISDDDLRFAIRAADDRMRAWLTLAAYAGLRCREIAYLRREDLLLDEVPPRLLVAKGKGGHQAVLPLNPRVERALRVHGLPGRGFVFANRDGTQLQPATVSVYMSRHLHGLGINAGAHALRHWYGSRLYAATNDLRIVQEMMRHSDPSTTAGYTAWGKSTGSEAVRALDVGDYGGCSGLEPARCPGPLLDLLTAPEHA